MRASRPVSLFTERPPAYNRPSAFVVSIIAHVGVVCMVVFGFLYVPRINMDAAAERYVVHRIEVNPPDIPPLTLPDNSKHYPTHRADHHVPSPHSKLAAAASSPRRLHLKLADKTLVEPKNQVKMVLNHAPVPSLLLWSKPQPDVTLVRPPQFKKAMLNNVRASLQPPNEATHVADNAITPTPFSSSLPMPIPSTTTPILVHAPTPADAVPETASTSTAKPTTMAVMSISNFNMSKGVFALPPANQTANGTKNGGMAAGHKGQGLIAGNENNHGTAKNLWSGGSPSTTSDADYSIDGPDITTTPLKLPEDGKYGVVVVGSTIQQEYPETVGLWGRRLVYSVFLHVGLAQNWILQFTLPASVDDAKTKLKLIKAPWPYFILRPNVDADYVNSNALMIHGFINDAGKFEHLALVLPPRYAHAQQLLDALKQWQFRPATRSGQPARVEVLLIMPEGGM